MIKRNKPKVNTVRGIVRNIRAGFIKVFKKDNINATTTAVTKDSVFTPGRRTEETKTAIADIIILNTKRIIFLLI